MATQKDDINTLKTDVAVIKSTYITFSKDFQDFKTDVKDNQKVIIDRMDKFAFVPITEFAILQAAFNALKEDVEKNYRKKSDGKAMRNVGYAVITSVAISFVTVVTTFIINGGLKNG